MRPSVGAEKPCASEWHPREASVTYPLFGRVYTYTGSGHAHAVRYAAVLGSGKFNTFRGSATGWWLCASYCALDTVGGEGVLRNGPSTGGGYSERATCAVRRATCEVQHALALQSGSVANGTSAFPANRSPCDNPSSAALPRSPGSLNN